MPFAAARRFAVAAIVIVGIVTAASAQESGARRDPPDETRYIGRALPDIPLSTTRGPSSLSAIGREGPMLITLVFTRCAGVCSPYLRSLRAASDARHDVRRLLLSFDPRDTLEDMRALAEHLAVAEREDWIFGTAREEDIRKVTEAIGFWFAWDGSRQQYDHPALTAAILRGRVVRLLAGGTVSAARLSEVMREMNGQFVESYPLPGRIRFRCFQYDANGFAFDWGFALLLVPAVFTCGATVAIFAAAGRRRGR
jgi:protein SCO1